MRSFYHPPSKKDCSPELGDLLFMLDCEDAGGRTQRAVLIQAKVASNGLAGQFSVYKGSPELQRYLYAQ
ncbi:MAG: hypothetical protein ABI364_05605 [Caldimonas sp.]